MGRPIGRKYFGNAQTPPVGGEGVNTAIAGNTGTNYSSGTTVTFSSPQLAYGTTATGSLSLNAFGNITAINVNSAGGGYTSTATVTVTTASSVSVTGNGTSATSIINVASNSGLFVGMIANGTGVGTNSKISSISGTALTMSVANANTVSGTILFIDGGRLASGFVTTLTTSRTNAITPYAFVVGGSSAVIGDIVKQEASRRYYVRTAQGESQCILATTSTLTAGKMYITAVDVTGASYFVDKLTSRKARLYRYLDNGGTFEFADGDVARWSLSAATTGTVQVANT